jgi:hypothetical protein
LPVFLGWSVPKQKYLNPKKVTVTDKYQYLWIHENNDTHNTILKEFSMKLASILLIFISLGVNCKPSKQKQVFRQPELKVKLISQTNLPTTVMETSGLLAYRDLLWTFNDSGGQPELYGYSIEDLAITKTVVINNGSNTDWEEITQDSTHVYIGDFGNNYGNRPNLTIYINVVDLRNKDKNSSLKQ